MLTFWASISCAHFQKVSNAISHIVQSKIQENCKSCQVLPQSDTAGLPVGQNINYLDDFLFPALTPLWCNQFIQQFIDICAQINFPLSMDKTEWATQLITFLGMLLDTINQLIGIPAERIDKALEQLRYVMLAKKVTARTIQSLAGLLNFLCKAIVPGRTFVRRMYDSISGLQQHHHLRVSSLMRDDCVMWIQFLNSPSVFARPFMDFESKLKAEDIQLFTDASRALEGKGFGCYYGEIGQWTYQTWEAQFVEECDPSIQFLELYALVVAIKLCGHHFKNRRIEVNCDNESVVTMVNHSTSKCPQ